MFSYNTVIEDTCCEMDFSSCENMQNTYDGATGLKVIQRIKVAATTKYTSTFSGCKALEKISFTDDSVIGNSVSYADCTLLDAESIDDILSHLGGAASATLTLPATAEATYAAKFGEGAFEEKVNARPSNWTIAY
jgi:hypothetical protein